MNDLARMLGEDLGDCTSCLLGDDVAPAQVEADAQNREVLKRRARAQRRIERVLRQNPVLADELGKFSIGGAFGALGKGLTAPLRVVGKVATGDFKGALKAAADPLGVSKLVRKGKHTIADVKGAIKSPLSAAAKLGAGASLAGQLGAKAGLPLGFPGTMPEIKIRCIPCDSNAAVSGDIAKKVVPEMKRIQTILDKMDLQRKATSEHNKRKKQNAWRKEVIRLLKQIQEKRCHA